MKKCPNCSYTFSRGENLIFMFKSKACPQCGVILAHDNNQFLVERFFFVIIWSVVFAFAATNPDELLIINQWLNLSLDKDLRLILFSVAFVTVYWIMFSIRLFFKGRLIQVQPQPPFKEQLKAMSIYEPMYPDFKFKLAWLIPIGFFVGLVGLVVCLVFMSERIAAH